MTRRVAHFYTHGEDKACSDLMKFIEESGVRLDVRDLEKQPMTELELSRLIGYCDIMHFLNPLAKAYESNKLGDKTKTREELIKMMAEDYTLIRKPIVKTSRLVTIGCDRKTVTDSLQLGVEPVKMPEVGNRVNFRGKNNHKSSKSSKPSRSSAYSSK